MEIMNSKEARAALDSVQATDRKMADKMRWPFRRHALFGLSEGLLVTGLGIEGGTGTSLCAAGVVLILAAMSIDKQRHGMFVSGMKGKSTRPLMWVLMTVLIGAVLLSLLVLRWEEGVNPAVVALGVAVGVFCTWASTKWEKLYRAELLSGEAR